MTPAEVEEAARLIGFIRDAERIRRPTGHSS